jgi:hypothetical protein
MATCAPTASHAAQGEPGGASSTPTYRRQGKCRTPGRARLPAFPLSRLCQSGEDHDFEQVAPDVRAPLKSWHSGPPEDTSLGDTDPAHGRRRSEPRRRHAGRETCQRPGGKEKPQQGRQGFWKRTLLGGMGVRRIRFTAAFSMPKSFRLAISGQRFVSAGPTTQIAPDHRELVKASAAPMPWVRAPNDRLRTMIEGERPPRAPPFVGRWPAPILSIWFPCPTNQPRLVSGPLKAPARQ